MLRQLSIFAQNKKGTMQHITGVLKQEDVNIWGSVTNDSAESVSYTHLRAHET